MDKFRFGLHLIGGIAIAAGLGGCADESPWGTSSGEKGTLDITLSTDSSFDTAKPLFRSGEETNTNDLGNFLTIPTQDKFTFTLHKSGSEEGPISWTNKNQTVAAGSYDLIAHYGIKGNQGFNSPYFEAKSAITILPGRTTSVDLSAELKNSMVQIVYTKEFQNYMSDYAVSLRTEGLTDMIKFPSKTSSSGTTNAEATEDKVSEIAFVEPKKAEIFIGFTTKNTGITVPSYSLGEFPPVAKTLYRIKLDVTERETGTAQLKVSFNESMTEEDRYIDLTDELLTTDPPKITQEGFTNGESINALDYTEASNKTLKLTVFAQGGLESANLTITGPELPLSTWKNEINLVGASELVKTALSSAGIEATTFFGTLASTNTLAELDLTGFCQKLASGSFTKGIYNVSLIVKDKTGKSDDISFSLDSNDIQLSPAAETDQQTIDYESDEVVLMLDYNGESKNDINFKYVDGSSEVAINNVTIEDVVVAGKPATRAYSNNRYLCTIPLPEAAKKSSITIKAYYPGGSKEFNFNVKVPGYELEYDAFAHYAYIKIVPDSDGDLSTILKNITYSLNNTPVTLQEVEGYDNVFLITGLSSSPKSGTNYTLQSAITTDTKTTITFTTEKEEAIPNGDFSSSNDKIQSETLWVGGEWRTSNSGIGATYHNESDYSYSIPTGWNTNNQVTANKEASNKNTWFIVPSSWWDEKNQRGYMRTVGYSHNGTTPSSYYNKGDLSQMYCNNTPNYADLDIAAGELILSEVDASGKPTTNDEISFKSRPSSISFDYEYKNFCELDYSIYTTSSIYKDDHEQKTSSHNFDNDEGYVSIEIIGSNKNTLKTYSSSIKPGKGRKTIQILYDQFELLKGAKLKIRFKSTCNADNKEFGKEQLIYIPQDEELSEIVNNRSSGKTKTISTNNYHALATGSQLWIDNVTAEYADAPPASASSAPKYKSTKKRR